MHHNMRSLSTEEKGFTLIELLVVILIIGVLAAIAIPLFINQKGKANDAAAKNDARSAQIAEETYFVDNSKYADGAAGLTSLESIEATLTPAATDENLAVEAPATGQYGATLAGGENVNNSFDVTITSQSGVQYAIVRRADGLVQRTCNVPSGGQPGGCKLGTTGTTGTW
jgi:type IV pilus assembly protein PilA